MAKPCLRKCVKILQRLIRRGITVHTFSGHKIAEIRPLRLEPKHHKTTLRYRRDDGQPTVTKTCLSIQ